LRGDAEGASARSSTDNQVIYCAMPFVAFHTEDNLPHTRAAAKETSL